MNLINCKGLASAGSVQVVKNDGDQYTTEWIAGYQAGMPIKVNISQVQYIKQKKVWTEHGERVCTELVFGAEQTLAVWETPDEVQQLSDANGFEYGTRYATTGELIVD